MVWCVMVRYSMFNPGIFIGVTLRFFNFYRNHFVWFLMMGKSSQDNYSKAYPLYCLMVQGMVWYFKKILLLSLSV